MMPFKIQATSLLNIYKVELNAALCFHNANKRILNPRFLLSDVLLHPLVWASSCFFVSSEALLSVSIWLPNTRTSSHRRQLWSLNSPLAWLGVILAHLQHCRAASFSKLQQDLLHLMAKSILQLNGHLERGVSAATQEALIQLAHGLTNIYFILPVLEPRVLDEYVLNYL